MINFEEELKKFHPSLEIENSADAIYNQDFTDMADVVLDLLSRSAQGRGTQRSARADIDLTQGLS
ncbi:MAG: hypothetical protein II759_01195 [Lachnospiraceae bacterium]|nr:hypothetical protein [Lachnospiraceae bacterium]